MDNYFNECPPRMNDSRGFTDFRSSQVREAFDRHQYCLNSENDIRMYRTNNADKIIDSEWNNIVKSEFCHPNKRCFHHAPTTRTTNEYNTSELLTYNGKLPLTPCKNLDKAPHFRMTETKESSLALNDCNSNRIVPRSYKCKVDKNNYYTQNIPTNLYPPSF